MLNNTSILDGERVTPDQTNRQLVPAWIIERLDSIQQKTTDQHTRLRENLTDDMDELRREMRESFRAIQEDLKFISKELNTVQTERRVEGQVSGRRSGWIALYASAGVSLFIELFRTFLPMLRRP